MKELTKSLPQIQASQMGLEARYFDAITPERYQQTSNEIHQSLVSLGVSFEVARRLSCKSEQIFELLLTGDLEAVVRITTDLADICLPRSDRITGPIMDFPISRCNLQIFRQVA